MHSILVLTSTYPRWNNDTEPAFVHSLCRELAQQYSVTVLAPHYPGASRREVLDDVTVIRFRYFLPFGERLAYQGGIIENLKRNRFKLLLVPFYLISQFTVFFKLCVRHKFDLIHAHWVIPQGLVAVLGRQLFCRKTKILCTSHGGDLFSLEGGFYQAIKRYVFNKCNHVTVVSRAMKQHLENMGWNTEHVSVQSMGVDLTTCFIPDSGTSKETDLVFVGRLVEKKGVRTLIEAVAYLHDELPELGLRIVGDGPEKPALEKLAHKLNVGSQIDFVGAKPNKTVPEFYRSARIVVVPSVVASDGDQEGLGLVAVEALGCGSATIVSDLPALRDVVQDGTTGLVFKSGSAEDLGKKIKRLLADDNLLERLARNGRDHVVKHFDWARVGSGYAEIIDSCIRT